jgi:hypothetical protein
LAVARRHASDADNAAMNAALTGVPHPARAGLPAVEIGGRYLLPAGATEGAVAEAGACAQFLSIMDGDKGRPEGW